MSRWAGKPVAADAGCSQRESRLLREGKAGERGSLGRGPAVGTPVVQTATGRRVGRAQVKCDINSEAV